MCEPGSAAHRVVRCIWAVLLLAACRRDTPPPPSTTSAPPSAGASAPVLSASAAASTAPAPPPRKLVVSAVGDCTLGGDYPKGISVSAFDLELAAHNHDLAYFFSGVRHLLAADDVTVANLEGVLTTRDEPEGDTPFHFRGNPSYAKILALGGVEVVNLANNHSHDFGHPGFADTRRALREAGVGACGHGLVDRRTVRGVEVVNVGYTGGGPAVKKRLMAEIRELKTSDNVVVASFHWGAEHSHGILPLQRDLGRAAIDAGADLVLGTHPHVIQGIETYRDRHIVYSLGNFVFGGNVNPSDKDAIIYQETFGEVDGRMVPVASQVIPVRVTSTPERNDFRPVVLEGAERARVLADVERYTNALPAR